MLQVKLLITETTLDTLKIKTFLAEKFLQTQNLQLDLAASKIETNRDWQQILNTAQIIDYQANSKSDFKTDLLGFFQTYLKPTLLFFPPLENLSLPFQEGLLKLLEEPPQNLYIVLFSQTLSQVLPTILSRSSVQKLPKNLIFQALNQAELKKTQKIFLNPVKFLTEIQQQKVIPVPDLAKTERQEINFWLWQVECYLIEILKKSPQSFYQKILQRVILAKQYNLANLQKKLVFETILQSWS